MWGHIKNCENLNWGYLIVLKGKKMGKNYKPSWIENQGNRNRQNQEMHKMNICAGMELQFQKDECYETKL